MGRPSGCAACSRISSQGLVAVILLVVEIIASLSPKPPSHKPSFKTQICRIGLKNQDSTSKQQIGYSNLEANVFSPCPTWHVPRSQVAFRIHVAYSSTLLKPRSNARVWGSESFKASWAQTCDRNTDFWGEKSSREWWGIPRIFHPRTPQKRYAIGYVAKRKAPK